MRKPYVELSSKVIPLTELKNNFSKIIEKMNMDNQERILLKRNKPAAAMIPVNRYDELMKMEERYYQMLDQIKDKNENSDI